MKVVILNGGKGTRLGLADRPKPMVPVMGKPLLERLLQTGVTAGFRDYIFLNGHMADVIESYFGSGTDFGVNIKHVRERSPLGTAGAVRQARTLLDESFIVLYGDILTNVDLEHFARFHKASGAVATLLAQSNDHPHDSDLIETDDENRIIQFLPKPHAEGAILPNLGSAAIYVMEPAAIDYVQPSGASDWGHDVFPAVIAAGGRLCAYRSFEYAKDIGTPERLARAEADLALGRMTRFSRRHAKPVIFLHRDGVLKLEVGDVRGVADLTLLADAAQAIGTINRAGIPAICVTSQPQQAKGRLSTENLRRIFSALDTALAKESAYLDYVYDYYQHPERGWAGEVTELKVDRGCRKLEPGMLLAAAREHNIDLTRSWLIGDHYDGVVAAQATGAKAALVAIGDVGCNRLRNEVMPDFLAGSLQQAVAHAIGSIG